MASSFLFIGGGCSCSYDVNFGPTSLPNLKAWFRADLGITLNGSTVSAWNDQSGTGDSNKNLTQGTAANQPTYVSSDSSYNNMPTVSFDGTNDYLFTGTWSSALAQPSTWYVVGQIDNLAGMWYIFDGLAAVRNAVLNDGTSQLYAVGYSLPLSTTNMTSKFVFSAVFDGASSKAYANNLTTTAASGTAGFSSQAGLTVGARYSGSTPLQGKIAEIIAYSGSHSTSDRTSVMNYLAARYTITVSP